MRRHEMLMDQQSSTAKIARNVPKEVFRLIVALCALTVVNACMMALQRNNDITSLEAGTAFRKNVFDRLLNDSPFLSLVVPDVILGVYTFTSLILHVVLVKPRFRLLITTRRFIWIIALGYALRAFSLMGTLIPPSSSECVITYRSWSEVLRAGPKVLLNTTCTDQMFSGHTLVATLITCFWWRLCDNRLVRLTVPLVEVVMLLTMLLSRHHYTSDIAIALIVGVCIFHIHHLLVEIVSIGEIVKRKKEENQQSAKGGEIVIQKVFSKYPAKLIRGLISFMDGIDIRPTQELRKH